MRFDKGFVTPYMVTNAGKNGSRLGRRLYFNHGRKSFLGPGRFADFEKVAQSGKKDLAIIADEVEGEALTTFVLNKLRGTFNVLAVKAPGFGDRRKEMLQDIAVLTGGRVITEDNGFKVR